ncbi:transcription initiation factor B [TFB] [Thermoplasma volcanium GSS1]|uniref:Transcription initiation factor IIB 2 n=1 Tax=Thermoplasma volcanium (strain ATCC 51530 / DSM 4299 / JCM 9571 / NBRC 15438 / GSS1) TaxID=273116 RepID=TF2B2_THEVO|nr:transcription initiation factor IIB [Thermoplasma volcanium]Q979P7.1 RecName: Full=Transcription initiation factor IIB 2; Short=TFIIB 2 [Thermoplasma volcanium GSS1]BAB60255.1 transcription initiation factor B [TFB] [Thermoplasma volcanium GSS1]
MPYSDKMAIESEAPKRCPECHSEHLIRDYEHGELICADCGAVIEDSFIDQGPEWRAFDSDQDERRARTGSPMTYLSHDKGLATEISWSNKDYYGKRIPHKNRAQIYRVRKWHQRIRVSNAAERNLSLALQLLNDIGAKLGIPKDIKETSALIYRKAVEKNLIRGRSIESIVCASIYAACRKVNIPRTLDEIAKASEVNKKKIGKAYRHLAKELDLNLRPTTPFSYIAQFCNKLDLDKQAIVISEDIVRQAMSMGISSGKGPTGIAAAAIYIASVKVGKPRTQKEIARISGVTEVTIRNRYKEISKALNISISE